MPGSSFMTPDQVHFGWVDAVHVARQVALDQLRLQSIPAPVR